MFTIAEVVASTGARLLYGDPEKRISGVSTDTRTLRPEELFFALSGPNHDGNTFATSALERGAGGLMLEGEAGSFAGLTPDRPVLLHPAPRRALTQLARYHRARLDIPVIGITGSCGKTTTKNILVQLLSSCGRVVGSPSSFNNDIGVPHTLFLADHSTEFLVVEMGTNHPGEIAGLCRTARPTCGVITNVGSSHLEGLSSVDGVAREKGDLAASLPESGFCVLGAECRYTPTIRAQTAAEVITFSVDGGGHLNARDVHFHSGGTTFRLEVRSPFHSRTSEHTLTSPLLGLHNVQNLLAALAACVGLDVEVEEVLPGVDRLKSEHRRLERVELDGLTLLDDSYNSNPESVKASVRTLAGMHGYGRRALILGDMHELGELSGVLHHEVGECAARGAVDLLVLVGELSKATAAGALSAGMADSAVQHFADVDSAVAGLPELLRKDDLVLVKGSRAAGLERLVENLRDSYGVPD